MEEFWRQLTNGFMPHGFCLRWDGPLLWTFVIGNAGIALAYFLIPLALRYFVGKRKDLPYPHMFKLFAGFILACGLTHLAKLWTIWQPVYWLEAIIDATTAVISLVTAFLLWPLIPRLLALRSPQELERANLSLEAEIRIRKEAEEQAEAARDEAIKANALKSQFVANVSHEIRTPMSGVIGLSELLTRAPELTPATAEIAQRMFESSNRLLAILNDLLDFSKLEAGRITVEEKEFSLACLLSEVSELCRPAASEKGLTLTVWVDPEVPPVLLGDGSKVRQVLLNLTHNAVKFTQTGSVNIRVEKLEQSDRWLLVRFAVSDTGCGINPEVQTRLFQPFVQADASTKRAFGGTGLGLSICKRFVELLGGQIGLTSEEGKGSTFWMQLPFQTGGES